MFEAVFQRSSSGMALIALTGAFIAVNDALSHMLGYLPSELMTLHFQDLTHPDDLQNSLAVLDTLVRGERSGEQVVKRYLHRQGRTVWANVTISVVPRDDGLPGFFVVQFQDVTLEREQQEELTELSDQLQLALNAAQDGLWNWWIGSPSITVTEQWNRLFGRDEPAGRVSARGWWRCIHPDDRRTCRQRYRQYLAGQTDQLQVSFRAVLPGSRWRWLELRGRIVDTAPDGRPRRLAGALTDVDERVQTQQDLKVLMDHLPAMIGYWDDSLHNRFGNRTYIEWFGRRAEQMTGRHMSEILGPSVFQRNRPLIERALRGEAQSFERQYTSENGHVRHTHMNYIPDIQDGRVRGFFALGVDVTAYRQTQQALEEQRELARVTLESIGDSVITTDPLGQVTFLNPVAQRLTGWAETEALGQPVERIMPLMTGPAGPVEHPLRLALRDLTVVGLSGETVLYSRAGEEFRIEDTAAPILGRDGRLLGGVVVFRDITEKQMLAERMTHLARHDALTGLPNRLLLQEHMAQAITHAEQSGAGFGVLFLDLDDFKQVNDTLGHSLGDRLLVQVAGRLRSELGSADLVSRQGGDEFIVLLPDCGDVPSLEAAGRRLIQALCEAFALDGQQVTGTTSMGAALYPRDGTDPDTLIRHADAAMYRAKREGGNRLRFYDDAIEARLRARQQLRQDVQRAVRDNEFHLVYQPQMNALTGELVGAEALLRWSRSGKTRAGEPVIGPASFIPLAEESGLMPALGAWVLREACAQAHRWWRAGTPVRVAVNVSAMQFLDPLFVQRVSEVLRTTELPARWLELEVTESMLVEDVRRVQEVLAAIRTMGVTVSIDDFGTGYSSLSYLHRLPVDTLKIDRSFMVTGVDDSQQSLLSAIVGLGRSLGLRVVAEGVETETQERALLRLGCQVMQGYRFSRPMLAEQFSHWRAERAALTGRPATADAETATADAGTDSGDAVAQPGGGQRPD